MKRKIIKSLLEWKNKKSKLPYMLIGARQVGKTYVINEFCKNEFNDYIYINLEKEPDIREIFEETLEPEMILDNIGIIKGKAILPKETVVFFDEIQVSERAITALKYFNESPNEYYIVCAGSLLGVALSRFKSSFPVGKVYREYLYPMDFEEFLWATGKELLANEIRKCFISNKSILEPVHEKALQSYRDFLFVGGMPASIIEYVEKSEKLSYYDRNIKRNILEDYIADMSKYTTNAESIKINELYKSIPRQLARESNKFVYNLVSDAGNKRMYETSIDWLLNSHLVSKCILVKTPQIPLIAYEDINYFKIYLNDVGLLCELAKMSPADLISQEGAMYKGMITENYVAQMFTSTQTRLNYWKSSADAEIDFLVNLEGNVIPVEVKAASNTKSKSLNVYVEKYKPQYAIRISAKNFGFVGNIKSVPLYAVHLIGESANT